MLHSSSYSCAPSLPYTSAGASALFIQCFEPVVPVCPTTTSGRDIRSMKDNACVPSIHTSIAGPSQALDPDGVQHFRPDHTTVTTPTAIAITAPNIDPGPHCSVPEPPIQVTLQYDHTYMVHSARRQAEYKDSAPCQPSAHICYSVKVVRIANPG